VSGRVGRAGYLSVSTTRTRPAGMGSAGRADDDDDENLPPSLDPSALGGRQAVSQGGVAVTLYRGRIVRGPLAGTRVLLKAYPAGEAADALAANELAAFAACQPPPRPSRTEVVVAQAKPAYPWLVGGGPTPGSSASASPTSTSPHLALLLGGFELGSGERWLAFRDDGVLTAEAWARGQAAGNAPEPPPSSAKKDGGWLRGLLGPTTTTSRAAARALALRRGFVLRTLRHALSGLAALHAAARTHGSLGPGSVLLSTGDPADAPRLLARLTDLAFSADCSVSSLAGGATLGELWDMGGLAVRVKAARDAASPAAPLWAEADALRVPVWDKPAYARAADAAAAGHLIAYLCLAPFAPPNTIDALSLARLLDVTCRGDMASAREFIEAEPAWAGGAALLAAGGGAGYDLVGSLLAPDWRARPGVEACLEHPFLTGAAFDD
jgi:hypothetical protein